MKVYKKEEQDDIALLSIAQARMSNFDPSALMSQASM